ncbi:ribosomal-processing cysteine protease Prp [Candidatus Phytoplasma prunorum]|uniref:ribosomal-processing cysteine protease Prp n=1 Tax=Candidatus Phytoplasma prunorum TaxID=47565 RepID=UPI002FF1AD69
MIYYYFYKKNEKIKKIQVFGHSLYNKKNNDIVCSSVSTAIILTLNNLKMLGLQKNIDYILKDGFLNLKILKQNSIMIILLNNLEYSLKELEKNYKKYIKEYSNIK